MNYGFKVFLTTVQNDWSLNHGHPVFKLVSLQFFSKGQNIETIRISSKNDLEHFVQKGDIHWQLNAFERVTLSGVKRELYGKLRLAAVLAKIDFSPDINLSRDKVITQLLRLWFNFFLMAILIFGLASAHFLIWKSANCFALNQKYLEFNCGHFGIKSLYDMGVAIGKKLKHSLKSCVMT